MVGHGPHDGNHARPAHEGDRDDEERQEVPDAQHAQAHEEENGAAGEKRRLVRAHLGVAEHVGHGALAFGSVTLGVAHVVHVHDGHDGKPQRDAGNKAYKREFMQVEEGAAHHGHDAEEQKAHEVAQADVAVGVLADGVADGGGDAGHAEHHEHNDGGPARPRHGRAAGKGDEDEGDADGEGEHARADKGQLHLLHGDDAALKPALGAHARLVVQAVGEVAVVVGEVGDDLQKDARDEHEHEDLDAELACRRRDTCGYDRPRRR